MDAQGFLNMFTNVNNMNNSDDNLGGGLDQEGDNDSAAAKRPYPELIPTFVSITGLVQAAGVEGNGIHATQVSNQDTAVLLHYP
jgi:hypothetical protein